jgi:hypothetical protein
VQEDQDITEAIRQKLFEMKARERKIKMEEERMKQYLHNAEREVEMEKIVRKKI